MLDAPEGPVPETAENATPAVKPQYSKDRIYAKSLHHLLTHTPASIFCEGCRAKARHKAHYRGTFNRNNHKNVVAMDQLTVSELRHSTGLGNFKYAIIFHEVDTDIWWFVPLRTLKLYEAEFHSMFLLRGVKGCPKKTVVRSDQHNTLKPMCVKFGCAVYHPPPGQPRHNPVGEKSWHVATGNQLLPTLRGPAERLLALCRSMFRVQLRVESTQRDQGA